MILLEQREGGAFESVAGDESGAGGEADHDGHVDLCFPGKRTLIYWGGDQGFATRTMSGR